VGPTNHTELAFLRYLEYEKASGDIGQYWIRSRSNTGCKAITTLGKIKTVPCDTKLPAWCSQSAPLSSVSSNNTGPEWQTTTGKTIIVGYHDKLPFRFLGLENSYPSQSICSRYQAPGDKVSVALAYGPCCIQSRHTLMQPAANNASTQTSGPHTFLSMRGRPREL
jgi:hypothetical protein